VGDIYSVYYFDDEGDISSKIYFDPKYLDSGSYPSHSIKFKGDNCVVSDNRCATFSGVGTLSGKNVINLLSGKDLINQTSGTTQCVGNNWFYVYDGVGCE
jgi:hypothetical protein